MLRKQHQELVESQVKLEVRKLELENALLDSSTRESDLQQKLMALTEERDGISAQHQDLVEHVERTENDLAAKTVKLDDLLRKLNSSDRGQGLLLRKIQGTWRAFPLPS